MSEEMIIKHCSPTLAGLKTANIFSCEYTSEKELKSDIISLNRRLSEKGLRIIPLSKKDNRALIYAFRPSMLLRDLTSGKAEAMLSGYGYGGKRLGAYIKRLSGRLHEKNDFPHEIGLFLGYPPEDVLGFIENDAKNFKFTGVWKVYGDEDGARKTFAKYRRCTDVYMRHYASGKSIEHLTVRT